MGNGASCNAREKRHVRIASTLRVLSTSPVVCRALCNATRWCCIVAGHGKKAQVPIWPHRPPLRYSEPGAADGRSHRRRSGDRAAGSGRSASESRGGWISTLSPDAAPDEKPNIHGFFESPFKTSYTTPRGLVVFDRGVVWQPVVGLVLPLGDSASITNTAVVAGIWNSVAGSLGDPGVGGWEEMDVFVSFGGHLFGKVKADITFGDWNFPGSVTLEQAQGPKRTSTQVRLRRQPTVGATAGSRSTPTPTSSSPLPAARRSCWAARAAPDTSSWASSRPIHQVITNYPITLTMPIYCSVGPASYWGSGESGGRSCRKFRRLLRVAQWPVPLGFIPAKYGYWHADAGVTYYYLKNDNILHAGTILSGNTNRNFVQGSVGVGVNF